MDWITNPSAWIALLTLTTLEIVLGIDNIIFISILSSKLPDDQQGKARQIGLIAALGTRILLLLSISWVVELTQPLFTVLHHPISGRDLILLSGGLFLLWKATHEIHDNLEGHISEESADVKNVSFASIIAQIAVLDIVFSLDSVITAVGMADDIAVMIIAVVIAVGIMLFAATPLSEFVHEHPTLKILALSFLLLIGLSLVTEAFHQAIPKGYIYFAMGFSVFVEIINLRIKTKATNPVKLRTRYEKKKKAVKES
ncbi:MAG: TerC family protein [Anaerolineae bacterium]|jgi:predicted tellurium resistance membrane protein TerC|nr:TerC family protein [Anaerolineae bacterium]MBT7076061.1 TerC family protein [Anaerolineae bacterium]MBT7782661.1 TerC family protein [Anaerolineae bacterium]